MDIIDKIISNVERTTKAVVQKSTDVVEITKIKLAISNAENEAQEITNQIGQLVYDAYKSGSGNPELVEEKCTQLEEIKKDIAEKKNQFAKLRNLKRCSECGYENDSEAIYCNHCGAKLPEVVGYEVDDMPDGSEQSEDVVIDADANDASKESSDE